MYCPNCGTQKSDNDKFCRTCGTNLTDASISVTSLPERSMSSGIICHSPECYEPVIGQCPGYKETCLRFYCSTHSVEQYCSVCAEQIAHDDAVQAIYRDYLETAKDIYQQRPISGGGYLILLPIIVCGSGLLLAAALSANQDMFYRWGFFLGNDELYGWGFFLGIVIGVLLSLWIGTQLEAEENKKVKNFSAAKPGFEDFWREYRKQRNAGEINRVASLTTLVVAGAASAAILEYKMHQDVRHLVRELKQKSECTAITILALHSKMIPIPGDEPGLCLSSADKPLLSVVNFGFFYYIFSSAKIAPNGIGLKRSGQIVFELYSAFSRLASVRLAPRSLAPSRWAIWSRISLSRLPAGCWKFRS